MALYREIYNIGYPVAPWRKAKDIGAGQITLHESSLDQKKPSQAADP